MQTRLIRVPRPSLRFPRPAAPRDAPDERTFSEQVSSCAADIASWAEPVSWVLVPPFVLILCVFRAFWLLEKRARSAKKKHKTMTHPTLDQINQGEFVEGVFRDAFSESNGVVLPLISVRDRFAVCNSSLREGRHDLIELGAGCRLERWLLHAHSEVGKASGHPGFAAPKLAEFDLVSRGHDQAAVRLFVEFMSTRDVGMLFREDNGWRVLLILDCLRCTLATGLVVMCVYAMDDLDAPKRNFVYRAVGDPATAAALSRFPLPSSDLPNALELFKLRLAL